jgi:hypothetical protein
MKGEKKKKGGLEKEPPLPMRVMGPRQHFCCPYRCTGEAVADGVQRRDAKAQRRPPFYHLSSVSVALAGGAVLVHAC